jgi:hypothetical protein
VFCDRPGLLFRVAGIQNDAPDIVFEYVEQGAQRPWRDGLAATIQAFEDDLARRTSVPAEMNDIGSETKEMILQIAYPDCPLLFDGKPVSELRLTQDLVDAANLFV